MEQTTKQDTGTMPPSPPPSLFAGRRKDITGALVLIIIGLLLLADNIIPGVHFGDYWPLILVAIGVGLLLKSKTTY